MKRLPLWLGSALMASSFFALRAQEPAESRSVWDGVYTEEQAKRGEQLYRKECGTCHGTHFSLTGGLRRENGGPS